MAISEKIGERFHSVSRIIGKDTDKVALVEMQRKSDGAVVNVICYIIPEGDKANVYPLAELLPESAAGMYYPPSGGGKFDTSAVMHTFADGKHHPVH